MPKAPPKGLHQFAAQKRFYLKAAPACWHSYLAESNSLTARLATLGAVTVKILKESRQRAPQWAAPLQIKPQNICLVREVLLHLNSTPVVYAKSWLPLVHLVGSQRRYGKMGNSPLGHSLFGAQKLSRQALFIGQLPADFVYPNLWGRGQLFIADGLPLVVSEYFLPALLDFA